MGDQLPLPTLDITRSAATQRELLDAGVLDLLVYLRCPACQARRTLRVPRDRRRDPKLERLLPRVPVRHWVFSLGESAQPYLVAQPRLRARVGRACVGAVFAWLRRAAAREGLPEVRRCGAVSAVHRVGATLEANVHVHALVLDGVYVPGPAATPVFHPLPAPRRRDLKRTLAELRSTIAGLLERATPPRPGPPLAPTRTRAVHRVVAGPPVRPVFDPSEALLQRDGELDVRAGPPVDPDDRALRSRLCRYVARAPFDPSAIEPGVEGRLRYRLHHPFADGTTHVELSPRALAERLEALAAGELRPPVGFHGMLAPGAAAVAMGGSPSEAQQLALIELPRGSPRPRSPTLGLRCPRCRRTLEIVGLEPAVSPRAA